MGTHREHLVEGSPNALTVKVYEPARDAGLRPVLLLHGFASSTALNWENTGWIRALTDAGRRVIAVDLPGHGASPAPEELDAYTPSRIRADLLQTLQDCHVRPLRDGDPTSGVDVVGYSLGARLGWEFGGTQPQLVHRMVLGGPASSDPLADFDLAAAQRFLADGTPIMDASTADLLRMAQLAPDNDLFALLSMVEAIKAEPFDPAHTAPSMPVLLIAGERDTLAETMPQLSLLLAGRGTKAAERRIAGRDHASTLTSRDFKQAAIDFLGAAQD
ncbi:hydrolase [Zafaria cholistanensis]|uniref:Hydrolase n=1 Tax=Zafaria cholistanensis TaxID=1682741 RepID=A0A5A7NLU0_9MICC|nr:alpha/beta fold hydrolase [Zafaria cholistanensis]GER21855.1 hydrolase [Zafaria cholistanensis]